MKKGGRLCFSLSAALDRGFDLPESARLRPRDGLAADALRIPEESADAVRAALHWVADLPDICRIIYLDKIARRTQEETARRLGITPARLSQALHALGKTRPDAYMILTGKAWTPCQETPRPRAVAQLSLEL